jgi:O-antigen ligase
MWSSSYRLTGYGALYNPLRSAHLFGFFCVVGLWLTISFESTHRQRLVAAIIAIICLLGTVLTGSRAPLFGLAVAGVYLIYFATPPRLFMRSLLIGALVVAGFCSMFWQQLTVRGLSLRPQIWSEVIKQWQEHPWFGAGYNAALSIKLDLVEDTFFDTHNIVLAALFYGGIIGAVLFCAMHTTAFYQAFRKQSSLRASVLASSLMIYGLTTLQFDGGSIIGRPNEFWLLLWFPIGLFLLLERNAIEHTTNN